MIQSFLIFYFLKIIFMVIFFKVYDFAERITNFSKSLAFFLYSYKLKKSLIYAL